MSTVLARFAGPACQLSAFLVALATGALPMSLLGQPGKTPYPLFDFTSLGPRLGWRRTSQGAWLGE